MRSARPFSPSRWGRHAGRVLCALGTGLLVLLAWQGWHAGDAQATLATLWSLCAAR